MSSCVSVTIASIGAVKYVRVLQEVFHVVAGIRGEAPENAGGWSPG
jgi:hypothetical protein